MQGRRRQAGGISGAEVFSVGTCPDPDWQQVVRRWPAIFQVQGRVAERHPASAGKFAV